MKIRIRTITALAMSVSLLAPAAGYAGQEPELAFTPSTNGVYDYGTVDVGQTPSQTFTLTNSGGSASGALTVGLTGSAAFTKTADACTGTSLGPGKSCAVTIVFSPTSAGSYTATLTATGRKTGVITSLMLTGTGVRHIYWSNGNGISRADVDGQNVNQFITIRVGDPHALAVDSGHIYWIYGTPGTIGRADLDGQNVNRELHYRRERPLRCGRPIPNTSTGATRLRDDRPCRPGRAEREPELHHRREPTPSVWPSILNTSTGRTSSPSRSAVPTWTGRT